MDGSHFDALTRTVTAPISRRVTLGGLAAGVLVALGLALEETAVLAKRGKGKNKNKKKNCPKDRRCPNKCCKADETCKQSRCINHCQDEKKNLGETDIDCGGTCVRGLQNTCTVGRGCNIDADCSSQVCEVTASGQKQCVFCRQSSDCARNATDRPACINHECFECNRDADCPLGRLCIEPVAGGCPAGQPCACRSCRTSGDCAPGQICDENGNCVNQTGCTPIDQVCDLGSTVCCDGGVCHLTNAGTVCRPASCRPNGTPCVLGSLEESEACCSRRCLSEAGEPPHCD